MPKLEELQRRLAAVESENEQLREQLNVLQVKQRVIQERAAWASETLELLQAMAKVGFYAYDLDAKKFEWSDSVFELLGRDPADGPATLEECERMVPPDDLMEARRLAGELLHDRRRVSFEHQVTPAEDHETRWALTTGKLIEDAAGRRRIVGTIQDITERREFQAQLQQSTKMEAVGRLAGGIAHDFNNMLTVIMSFNAFALDQVDPHDPLYRDLKEIADAADRAAAVTNRLLAFSRRRSGSPRYLQVNETLAQMSRLLERIIGETITYQVDLRSTWSTRIDPGELEQVLVNLVVNARDAMPDGGVLRVRTRDQRIDPDDSSDLRGDYVCISVSDTGAGMDESTRSRIFDPFFTTKPAAEGTGLGLSTVYGIIQDAQGFIEVDTALGEGTTFTILLPRARARAAEVLPAHPRAGRECERILVVDEDPVIRDVAQRALRRAGYAVETARSGSEAMNVAEALRSLDLLVVDTALPDLSPPELARLICSKFRSARVLYVRGSAEEPPSQTAAAGPQISKPFTPERLCDAVRNTLDISPPTEGHVR